MITRYSQDTLSRWQAKLVRVALVVGLYVGMVIVLIAIGNMASQSPLSVLLCIPLIGVVFIGIHKLNGFFTEEFLRSRALFLLLQVASLAIMIYVGYMVAPKLRWDWGTLLQTASSYVLDGNFGDNVYYLNRYPHNRYWFEILVLFFKACHAVYPLGGHTYLHAASAALGVIIVQSTIVVIRIIALKVFGTRWGFLTWLFCLAYTPFYCYSPIVYNDTPAMLICALMILCYQHIKDRDTNRPFDKRGVAWLCLLGILCGVSFNLRIVVLIVPIAMLMERVLYSGNWIFLIKRAFFVLILFAFSSLLCQSFASLHYTQTPSDKEAYEIPTIHYISMSFKQGFYNADDVSEMYAIDTYNERHNRGVERLKERLAQRGILGSLEFAFVTKQAIIWGNSMLSGDYYISMLPRNPNSLPMRILSRGGDLYHFALPLYWSAHLTLLFGILFASACSLLRSRGCNLWALLSVIGVFLFFTIWECNARYLLCFLPAIIICSASGWSCAVKELKCVRQAFAHSALTSPDL